MSPSFLRLCLALAVSGGSVAVRAADFEAIPQAEWATGSPAPRPERMIRHTEGITSIVLHHTQTPNEPPAMERARLRNVQRYHIEDRGWGDVAYHFFIGASGKIYAARDAQFRGDSGTKYDLDGRLLICVLGDFSKVMPSDEAMAALPAFVAVKLKEHGLAIDAVFTHQMVAATDCPGATLQAWFEREGKAAIAWAGGGMPAPEPAPDPVPVQAGALPISIPEGFNRIPSLAVLPAETSDEQVVVDLRLSSPDETCHVAVTVVRSGRTRRSEASCVIEWKAIGEGEEITSLTSNRDNREAEVLREHIGVSGPGSGYQRYFQRSYPVAADSDEPAVLWEWMVADSAARKRWEPVYRAFKESLRTDR